MRERHLATLRSLLAFGSVPALAQQTRYPFNDLLLPIEKWIDNLLSLMTIDEKINCLSTNTGVRRLGVMNSGSFEAIH
jgi:beta-glucosidase